MVRVIKGFADSTDHFKRYEKGDTYKGDAKREKFLIANGYAEKITEKKEKKPSRSKKEK